jgi:hypothetical protein
MSKPLSELFAVSVSYNELLERWVAINNRDQKIVGYGENAMEAFSDYILRSTDQAEEAESK